MTNGAPLKPDTDDQLLMELVDAGLAMPAAEREHSLRQLCPNNPEILQQALQRIEWDLEMGEFLAEPVLRTTDPGELKPGQMLGSRIQIIRQIAEGGMAVVYEAQDERIDRVAVKVPRPAFRRRLIAEARLALRVTHPNICRVHGVETAQTEAGAIDFLTMEFLAGETLQERLRRSGPLTIAELGALSKQLCAGLGEAHGRGIVHGDLKGSNVILTADEAPFRAVITDFGLARTRGSSSAAIAASVRGTPDFLAPEIWMGGSFSMASDIYALGVLLYEAATGKRPFADDPARRNDTRFVSSAQLRKELPRKWAKAIDACVRFRPEDRPQDAGTIARAFQPFWSASPGTLTIFVMAIVLAGAAGTAVRWEHTPAEPIRLAVLPMEADTDSFSWGGGALQQASNRLAGFRAPHGSLVLMPSIRDTAQNAEKTFIGGGATHLLRARFRQTGSGMQADFVIRNAKTGQDLKAFTGTYTSASIGALPQALIAFVSSALDLKNGPKQSRILPGAWADYLRGEGELQKPNVNWEAAIASFQAATKADPETGLPWAGIATALVLEYRSRSDPKLLETARDALREATSRDPDGIEVHLAAGAVYRESGLPEKAVTEYSRVLQFEPGNVDAMRRLAGAYSDMQLPDQAVLTWQQAITQLPQYYQPYLELGQFYYYHAQYKDAAQQFLKVTQLAPSLAMGHQDLGAVYNDLGRFDDAEQEFRKALSLREHSDTLIGLGAIMDYLKRRDEAVAYYERARQVGPVTYLLLTDLADAYRRVQRSADASTTYKEALTYAERDLLEKPRDGYIRAFVAYLYARLGDRDRADVELAQALRLSPDQTKVKRIAIRTLGALGKRGEAQKILGGEPTLESEMQRQPDASEFLVN